MSSCAASSFSQGEAFISSKPGAHDDFHVFAAEALRRAAAVHRGVAAAQDDHALADLFDVPERDAREPVDADVDVGGRFLAARNVEIAPARRAGADENRVIVFGEQRFQAVDALARAEIDADIEDIADFLVDDRFRAGESAGSACGSCRPRAHRRRRR